LPLALSLFDPVTLKVALLCGLLGMESSAALQLMLSRPLVVGWMVGLVCGDARTGLVIGSLLEMLYGGMLPVGAYIPPDYHLATAITVAGALRLQGAPGMPASDAVMVFMLLCSIPLAQAASRTEGWARRANVGLCHWADQGVSQGRLRGLRFSVGLALALELLRGTLLGLLGIGVMVPLLGRVVASLPPQIISGLSRMTWLLLALGLAVMADMFWNRRLVTLLASSFAIAWLLIHLLHVPLAAMAALALAGSLAAALLAKPSAP